MHSIQSFKVIKFYLQNTPYHERFGCESHLKLICPISLWTYLSYITNHQQTNWFLNYTNNSSRHWKPLRKIVINCLILGDDDYFFYTGMIQIEQRSPVFISLSDLVWHPHNNYINLRDHAFAHIMKFFRVSNHFTIYEFHWLINCILK